MSSATAAATFSFFLFGVAVADLSSAWTCLESGGCQEVERADLEIGQGIVLRRSQALRQGKSVTEEVDGGLYSRIAGLFSGRSLEVKLPVFSGRDLEQGIEEGRGKMKKMMGPMMMMGAMKAMMVIPMMLGTLFLLAGKALIIAKVALVLALVITLKKLVAAKQADSGHHGWSGGDRRSLGAHDLAYSAYRRH